MVLKLLLEREGEYVTAREKEERDVFDLLSVASFHRVSCLDRTQVQIHTLAHVPCVYYRQLGICSVVNKNTCSLTIAFPI